MPTTSPISDLLSVHHHRCDEAWAHAEGLAVDKQWAEARRNFAQFLKLMQVHFDAEEGLLFPAFEAASGVREGPTEVMRVEHEQLRELFAQLQQALAASDLSRFSALAETALVLMQQHNFKEEQMLYPMCDEVLEHDGRLKDTLSQRLSAVQP